MISTLSLMSDEGVSRDSPPLIAVQFPQRWLGINSEGLLLNIKTNDGGVIISASELVPGKDTLLTLRGLVSQVEDESLLVDNKSKTEQPPPDRPNKRVSRFRVATSAAEKGWEYHFFNEEDLPVPLQKVLVILESAAKDGKALQAAGLIICDDLTRPFSPDGLTYAEMHRRNGIPFMPVGPDSFPFSYKVLTACALQCGTLEKVTTEQAGEINRINIRHQGAIMLSVGDKDVGCVFFPLQTLDEFPLPLPRDEKRRIVDEPDAPVDSPAINPQMAPQRKAP